MIPFGCPKCLHHNHYACEAHCCIHTPIWLQLPVVMESGTFRNPDWHSYKIPSFPPEWLPSLLIIHLLYITSTSLPRARSGCPFTIYIYLYWLLLYYTWGQHSTPSLNGLLWSTLPQGHSKFQAFLRLPIEALSSTKRDFAFIVILALALLSSSCSLVFSLTLSFSSCSIVFVSTRSIRDKPLLQKPVVVYKPPHGLCL